MTKLHILLSALIFILVLVATATSVFDLTQEQVWDK